MTYEELQEELGHLFPRGYQLEQDLDGQFIVYTGLIFDPVNEASNELVESSLYEELPCTPK
jgi:hypothetical protein